MGWDCSISVMFRARIIFICGDACGHQASSSNLILSTTTVLVFCTASSTSNLHIHFSFLYLALIGFEWKGQGYMTSIHETTTTRGKNNDEYGENRHWRAWLTQREPGYCHLSGMTKYIRMMRHNAHILVLFLLFFSGNTASGIGVFDVLHIIFTFATLRFSHSTGGDFRVPERLS